jgi:hypothetical protein
MTLIAQSADRDPAATDWENNRRTASSASRCCRSGLFNRAAVVRIANI